MRGRCVLHLDLDAFFASVEQLDEPSLRGRPVLVGSRRPRGVVAAASYEARRSGCRSAQPMAVALRLCPGAIVRPVRMARYVELSARVFALLEAVSPLVEPLSIDEAFLDLSGTQRLLGPPEAVGAALRARVREETGLTASVGIAPNKFVAKLATDLGKPDGLTVVLPERVQEVLAPLPVERLAGVGPRTAERLHAAGIRRVADLRRFPPDVLERRLGAAGPTSSGSPTGSTTVPWCRTGERRASATRRRSRSTSTSRPRCGSSCAGRSTTSGGACAATASARAR